MGLFDIFRRRAKETPASQAEETPVESTATTSTAASEASESAADNATSVASEASAAAETSEVAESTVAGSVPVANSDSADTNASLAATATSDAAVETETSETSRADSASVTADVLDSVASATSAAATVDTPTEVLQSTPPASSASAEVETPATTVEESSTTDASAPEASDEQLYDKGLEKTRTTFGQRLNALLANFRHVDESFFDDLEETLIGADVGFDMAVKLSDELRDEVKLQNAKKSQDVQNVVVEKLVEIYEAAGNHETTAINMAETGPTVILFVGVNGVGKTTTIGKMANRYHQAGKKVLLAAADTFRAGATEQLDVWAKRADVDIVTGKPQSDPAAVVFDAVQKAKQDDYDILFVDTAGRLQNKVNLMNELEKMKRIITREIPSAPHEVLLVLDATTGQNALTQAKLFKESTAVTGIVLTKLDGTARGGIVLAIRNELHVPVKFIGLGEQISDLRPFDPNEFVYGLFKGLIDVKALDNK
ncbi:signal recognition particle-docking protein FtsY [Levilactobacillus brevis]|uniref:signal recognition particle-docking protein FtsY n=1 Tax=Levilactobacillus TaxID=2767886 RepID=UPI0012E8BCB5|nr:signal recognition particle-docking protein FtsY [Levilactobacillus brevis]MBL3536602.1 signal recognition particle-docking protein FtsY [Lactobacillus sp. GPR40-2]MBL3629760.1 signal recognition particle-docking protein FtsY [Lactobacillus sp. GPB7-4]MCS8597001.1 signal recognition particle-docking protein FtsY [Levilactobacillus brevis]MCT3565336.1 signal recognition particle-docking protein FtsY [Levilactobacillus brevis]MCU0199597.1 signal recognition particle-docking protein FtsY [Levi